MSLKRYINLISTQISIISVETNPTLFLNYMNAKIDTKYYEKIFSPIINS